MSPKTYVLQPSGFHETKGITKTTKTLQATKQGGWVLDLFRWRSEGDAKKGTGRKRQKMSWRTDPLPLQAFFLRGPPLPLPLMSSQVHKTWKLAREVRGSKDKTNGRERDALSWHFLSRPLPGVPFWPSPIVKGKEKLKKREGVPEMATKPLKALRGYLASNRGSKNSNRGFKGL